MLSYRHGYHAGNHADVLKHVIQLLLIDHLKLKDKPFWVIDTHAGAGSYSLKDTFPSKNREYETGALQLYQASSVAAPPLRRYLDAISTFNPQGKLDHYPGSPQLSLANLRPQDRLRLFEMHCNENKILRANMRDPARRALVIDGDGFQGLKGLLPPPTRRALVLIDPSYELDQDYQLTKACLTDSVKRFPLGIYALWYPLLAKSSSREMTRSLQSMQSVNWLSVTLTVGTANARGMYGSGLFIINPPWTLHDRLIDTMAELARLLGRDENAGYTLDSHSTDKI